MRTVRRIYFYLVTFVSLQIAASGASTLLGNLLNGRLLDPQQNMFAEGLSLLLVSLPVLLLHWGIAQRDARRDPLERADRIRAAFLYLTQAVALVIAAVNVMTLFSWLGRRFLPPHESWQLMPGEYGAWNFLAWIAVELLVWFVFRRITAREWREAPGVELVTWRRAHRYFWVVYATVLFFAGCTEVINFWISPVMRQEYMPYDPLLGGLGNLLVAIPAWVIAWRRVQVSLKEPGESTALLRLMALYLLALAGAAGAVANTGGLLGVGFRALLGESFAGTLLLDSLRSYLPMAIPAALIWGVYHGALEHTIDGHPTLLQRASLRRLYTYSLVLVGTSAVLFGLWQSFNALIEMSFATGWDPTGRVKLGTALGMLVVGLPLWWITWGEARREAAGSDELAEHARRSVVRKAFLYRVIFASVVLGMVAAGLLINVLVNQLAIGNQMDFVPQLLKRIQTVLLLGGWLAFYLNELRQDGRASQAGLHERHAAYPVLVLHAGDPTFAAEMSAELARQSPHLPVRVVDVNVDALPEVGAAAALIAPAALVAEPGDALRAWLAGFAGPRVAVPGDGGPWTWAGLPQRSARQWQAEAAQWVRNLAEGQSPAAATTSPRMIAAYIAGELLALALVMIVLASFLFE